MGSFLIFLAILVLLYVIQYNRIQYGRDLIERDLHYNNCQLVDVKWAPWGPGWFGEKNDTILEVVYIDNAGFKHKCWAKTNFYSSSVYYSNDMII